MPPERGSPFDPRTHVDIAGDVAERPRSLCGLPGGSFVPARLPTLRLAGNLPVGVTCLRCKEVAWLLHKGRNLAAARRQASVTLRRINAR